MYQGLRVLLCYVVTPPYHFPPLCAGGQEGFPPGAVGTAVHLGPTFHPLPLIQPATPSPPSILTPIPVFYPDPSPPPSIVTPFLLSF